MNIDELASILETTKNKVKKALENLKKEYEQKDSALTIQEIEGKYKLNIKKEHAHITTKLLSDTEMDTPTTNTLAIVAYKSPVTQSEVIKIRGNKAYEHIKQLKESNLISSEKQGRTRLLKLTNHFYDYFDVAKKEVKEQFNQLTNKMGIKEEKKVTYLDFNKKITLLNLKSDKKCFL